LHDRLVADAAALTQVGQALQQVLEQRLVALGSSGFARQPHAVLVRSEDLDRNRPGNSVLRPPALSLYAYRVTVNRATRAAWSAVASVDGRPRLPVDLHILLTAWADNAEEELLLLGRGLLLYEETPTITGPLLGAGHGFAPTEAVQIIHDDVAPDVMMRVFEALSGPYRLSVAYIARVVRVESQVPRPIPDVSTVIAGAVPTVPV
jgi:hypothetical protein